MARDSSIPVSVGGSYACTCGLRDIEKCNAGIDCTAVRMTKEIRQRQSAANLADGPRRERERERAQQAVRDFRERYGHMYERFATLGIDPHDMKDFLNELPDRD